MSISLAKILYLKHQHIVLLSETASKELPSRGQVYVVGTIGGHSLSVVLEPDGRWGHWFRLSKDLQRSLKVKEGDSVEIDIEPSKDWPEPTIPEDFMKVLNSSPEKVQELWRKVTTMARWEWIRWINATSVSETRERRIVVSISKLASGKRRPCCFNLAACTDPELSKNSVLLEA